MKSITTDFWDKILGDFHKRDEILSYIANGVSFFTFLVFPERVQNLTELYRLVTFVDKCRHVRNAILSLQQQPKNPILWGDEIWKQWILIYDSKNVKRGLIINRKSTFVVIFSFWSRQLLFFARSISKKCTASFAFCFRKFRTIVSILSSHYSKFELVRHMQH